MDNATFVFEIFLRDNVFMGYIDNYIRIFMNNDIIELKGIPQLVVSIVELLHTKVLNGSKLGRFVRLKKESAKVKHVEFNLTLDDTYLLLDLYRNYILDKLEFEETLKNEFSGIYNICVKLAVTQLTFAKQKRKIMC